jgi:uncharacterized membrane protein
MLALIAADLWQNKFRYWQEVVGTLGWLHLRLPNWLLTIFTVSLLAAVSVCYAREARVTFAVRLAFLGIVGTELLLYLVWNEAGASPIEGVQGRYLLPSLLFLCLSSANPLLVTSRRNVIPVIFLLCTLGNICALVILARETWW